MSLAAATDLSLAWAAVPTSIAAVVVGWFTYRATRTAVPTVKDAAQLEPRLSGLEDRQAGWIAALAAKDQTIDLLTREVDQLRWELQEARGITPPRGGPAAQ